MMNPTLITRRRLLIAMALSPLPGHEPLV
ncbi:hypothetical protein ACQT31_24540, partial [Klebsiella pneumoniae]